METIVRIGVLGQWPLVGRSTVPNMLQTRDFDPGIAFWPSQREFWSWNRLLTQKSRFESPHLHSGPGNEVCLANIEFCHQNRILPPILALESLSALQDHRFWPWNRVLAWQRLSRPSILALESRSGP
jgi:hypothetical protein